MQARSRSPTMPPDLLSSSSSSSRAAAAQRGPNKEERAREHSPTRSECACSVCFVVSSFLVVCEGFVFQLLLWQSAWSGRECNRTRRSAHVQSLRQGGDDSFCSFLVLNLFFCVRAAPAELLQSAAPPPHRRRKSRILSLSSSSKSLQRPSACVKRRRAASSRRNEKSVREPSTNDRR